MSQGFSAGKGTYDDVSKGHEGLGVDGGRVDKTSGLSAGLSSGPGSKGLSHGLDGDSGGGEKGSGFDAGVADHSTKSGGGVTLDGGKGDVDQYGQQGPPNLGEKIKDAGQNIKDKLSSK